MAFLDLDEALAELGATQVGDYAEAWDPERTGLGILRDSFQLRRVSFREVADRKEYKRAFEQREDRRQYKRRWYEERTRPKFGRRGHWKQGLEEGELSMQVTTFLKELRRYGLLGSAKLICFGRDFALGEGIRQLVEPSAPKHLAARTDLMVQLFVAKGWGLKRIAKFMSIAPETVKSELGSRNVDLGK